jgi:hypothetical protein
MNAFCFSSVSCISQYGVFDMSAEIQNYCGTIFINGTAYTCAVILLTYTSNKVQHLTDRQVIKVIGFQKLSTQVSES